MTSQSTQPSPSCAPASARPAWRSRTWRSRFSLWQCCCYYGLYKKTGLLSRPAKWGPTEWRARHRQTSHPSCCVSNPAPSHTHTHTDLISHSFPSFALLFSPSWCQCVEYWWGALVLCFFFLFQADVPQRSLPQVGRVCPFPLRDCWLWQRSGEPWKILTVTPAE